MLTSFLLYYYLVGNAVFELWSVPSNGLWGLDVSCKLSGFKQIGQVSVKFSVNGNGRGFIDVSLDYVTVVSIKQPFHKLLKLVGSFCI